MRELNDQMIMEQLNNAAFMGKENTLIYALMIGALVILGGIFILSHNKRQKFSSLGLLILFEAMLIIILGRNNYMKEAIEDGKWFVLTDTVEQVMQVTDEDGDRSYYMILEKVGRVSLDNIEEASQYYTGDTAYIVVVMKDGKYKSTGVSYPSNYYYTGSHR